MFTALQATLGGIYVNDFNLFGRTWQVNIQGEARDRSDISDDLARSTSATRPATMVPLRSIADVRIITGPAGHHPLQQLPLGDDQRRPDAGRLVGRRRSRRWTQISPSTLPAGYSFEWTGTAYQEQRPPGRPA